MMQLDVSLTPPLPASNLGSAEARGGKSLGSRLLGLALICAGRIEFGCLTKRLRHKNNVTGLVTVNVVSFIAF